MVMDTLYICFGVANLTITYIAGQFKLSTDQPIILKPGVSLHGNRVQDAPTILVGGKGNETATISGEIRLLFSIN